MSTTFELACVGDRVWCMRSGWGDIRATDASAAYPIYVYFSGDEYKTYTAEGFHDLSDISQTLFWDEVVIEAPEKPVANLTSDANQVSELRDHIAISYMQSCVSGNAYFETFEGVPEEAYKMADAMLEERSK